MAALPKSVGEPITLLFTTSKHAEKRDDERSGCDGNWKGLTKSSHAAIPAKAGLDRKQVVLLEPGKLRRDHKLWVWKGASLIGGSRGLE